MFTLPICMQQKVQRYKDNNQTAERILWNLNFKREIIIKVQKKSLSEIDMENPVLEEH